MIMRDFIHSANLLYLRYKWSKTDMLICSTLIGHILQPRIKSSKLQMRIWHYLNRNLQKQVFYMRRRLTFFLFTLTLSPILVAVADTLFSIIYLHFLTPKAAVFKYNIKKLLIFFISVQLICPVLLSYCCHWKGLSLDFLHLFQVHQFFCLFSFFQV